MDEIGKMPVHCTAPVHLRLVSGALRLKNAAAASRSDRESPARQRSLYHPHAGLKGRLNKS